MSEHPVGPSARDQAAGRARPGTSRLIASRRGLLAAAALLAAPTPGRTQGAFPSAPVTIVVPFPPGGAVDSLARAVAEKLRAAFRQPVVVDNRAGGAGHVGAGLVARAQPDGYTLVCLPQLSFNADLLYAGLTYDPRGFEPVSVLATYPNVLLGRSDLPFSTVPELLARAREQPGRLTYGSQGNGQIAHLTFELLSMMAGIRMTHVPYRGSGPLLTALLSGEVDLTADNLLTMGGQVAAGQMKLLAVTGPDRLASHPTVPAVAEFIPGFLSDTWIAIGAPPRTPLALRERLAAAIDQAVHAPDLHDKLTQVQAEPFGRTPEAMAGLVRESRDRWAPVIRTAQIRIE